MARGLSAQWLEIAHDCDSLSAQLDLLKAEPIISDQLEIEVIATLLYAILLFTSHGNM